MTMGNEQAMQNRNLRIAGKVLIAAMLGAPVLLPSMACAELTLSGAVDYLSWTETTTPEVKETGPLYALGVAYTQDRDAGALFAYRGKLWGGSVNYEGATLFGGTPVESTTDYFGASNELQARWRKPGTRGGNLDGVLGVGLDVWRRSLSSVQNEDYAIGYLRLGVESGTVESGTTRSCRPVAVAVKGMTASVPVPVAGPGGSSTLPSTGPSGAVRTRSVSGPLPCGQHWTRKPLTSSSRTRSKLIQPPAEMRATCPPWSRLSCDTARCARSKKHARCCRVRSTALLSPRWAGTPPAPLSVALAVSRSTPLAGRPHGRFSSFSVAVPDDPGGSVSVRFPASERIQSTICAASPAVCCGCGGMGSAPHPPVPPDKIFAASRGRAAPSAA